MENDSPSATKPFKMSKRKFNWRRLRLSLKFRPEILQLILKMRLKIRKKAQLFDKIRQQLKSKISPKTTTSTSTQTETFTEDIVLNKYQSSEDKAKDSKNQDVFTQTDDLTQTCDTAMSTDMAVVKEAIQPSKLVGSGDTSQPAIASDKNGGWSLNAENGENEKSIAEQVKEAAQSAMQQSGMVYVESAGMYYDYKTGYYYSAELGLYYHPDTGCYYSYSEDKQTFVFHSYPDRSKTTTNPMYEAHEKKKARKLAREKKREETNIENLTKNLSQGKEECKEQKKKAKRRKRSKEKITEDGGTVNKQAKVDTVDEPAIEKGKELVEGESEVDEADNTEDVPQDLEEGECSESDDEKEEKKEEDVEADESDASTISDIDDSIAKHHPPSMRVIVRETSLPKLKVGSLFLVTKDGGTVGREGSEHTIILEDSNVSRKHLDIKYDMRRKIYTATDLGSKNGTTLNGVRISESQVISDPVEVMHGSTLQLGDTKLLCHIHPGSDTCGHCEPGLVMDVQEKEKKAAYTRTCSVQKQHELELARLKNKYAPKPLAIEETAYNDRAKERRAKVGSSHHSEKTQSSNLETFIAPENKGFKLLEKMGWSKGEGLGKDNQGDIEPVPLVSNDKKSGLGTAGAVAAPPLVPIFAPKNSLGPSTMRLAAKTNMLRPPAKVFQDPLDEDSE